MLSYQLKLISACLSYINISCINSSTNICYILKCNFVKKKKKHKKNKKQKQKQFYTALTGNSNCRFEVICAKIVSLIKTYINIFKFHSKEQTFDIFRKNEL